MKTHLELLTPFARHTALVGERPLDVHRAALLARVAARFQRPDARERAPLARLAPLHELRDAEGGVSQHGEGRRTGMVNGLGNEAMGWMKGGE